MPEPSAPLAHQVYGPREGHAVVLLHGFPFDRHMWRLQANALASAGLRVAVPDLAGFGQSEGLQTTMDGHARDVLALLDRLRIDRFTPVGFSMGGYVALAVAAAAPQRLSGLVLIDTRAGADDAEGKAKRDAAIADVQANGVRGLANRQLEGQLTANTRQARRLLVDEVRAMMMRQGKATVVAALQAMRDRPDRSALLHTLSCPALVVVGAEDKVTPLAAAQQMVDALGDATLHVVEGAAHLSPMEQPHDVNAALLAWFATP